MNGSAQKVREGTTRDGTFTLKHGQYAALTDNIKANTVYRASEIGAYSDKYEVIVNSTTAKAEGPDGSTQVYQSEDLVVEERPAVDVYKRQPGGRAVLPDTGAAGDGALHRGRGARGLPLSHP